MKLRCLVVDDELPARQLMVEYIRKVTELELVAVCNNGFEAKEKIATHEVDLLLLDIHMPGISGVDLVKSLKQRPLTIFITAYQEYAVEGFELDVIDYLVKPFSLDRFKRAIDKAIEYIAFQSPADNKTDHDDFFFLKTDSRIIKFLFSEVIVIEAQHEYVKVITKEKKVMAHMSMNQMATILTKDFIRIHRSYIINLRHVDEVRGNLVLIGRETFPIGKSYKESFLARL